LHLFMQYFITIKNSELLADSLIKLFHTYTTIYDI
jgi:hypothetical protein